MLNLSMRDCQNLVGHEVVTRFVGKKFKHSSNGKVYQVIGLCWLGSTDEWGLVHAEVLDTTGLCSVPVVRSVENFVGVLPNGAPRYVEVPAG